MAVIKGASVAFCLAVILTVSLAVWALEWFHSERFEIQAERISFYQDQLLAHESERKGIYEDLAEIKGKLVKLTADNSQRQQEEIKSDIDSLIKDLEDKGFRRLIPVPLSENIEQKEPETVRKTFYIR